MGTELLVNNFACRLTAGVAPADTTIQVDQPAPAGLQGGQFRVLVDQEYMLVTGGQSGTVWTVVRGSGTGESPTPSVVGHAQGTWVTHVLTAGALFGGSLGSVASVNPGAINNIPILQPDRRPPHPPNAWSRVGNAVIAPTAGGFDSSNAQHGFDVVWDQAQGQYALLYAGYDGSTTTKIGGAYSDDLFTWTKWGGNPVFGANGTGGQPDSGGVSYPQIYNDGTNYHMFYIGFTGAGLEQGTPTICRATAPVSSPLSTATWTRQGTVLAASAVNAGYTVIYRPKIIKVGQVFYLFFNVGAAAGNEQIWYATASSPAGPWTVGQQVIAKNAVGYGFVSDPEVALIGDKFLMYFWSSTPGGQPGLYTAVSQLNEFPNTWHVNSSENISFVQTDGLGGACRATFVDRHAAGPLLFCGDGSTNINVYAQLANGAHQYDRDNGQRGMYCVPGGQLGAPQTGSSAVTANRAYMARFCPSRRMVIKSIAFIVAVAAGSNDNVDVGIFANDGVNIDPNGIWHGTTLLGHSGATAGKLQAAGNQAVTLATPIIVQPGVVYYVAIATGPIGTTAAQLVTTNMANAFLPSMFGTGLGQEENGVVDTAYPLTSGLNWAGNFVQAIPLLAIREY